MEALIDDQGRIGWGIYDEPIQSVNSSTMTSRHLWV